MSDKHNSSMRGIWIILIAVVIVFAAFAISKNDKIDDIGKMDGSYEEGDIQEPVTIPEIEPATIPKIEPATIPKIEPATIPKISIP